TRGQKGQDESLVALLHQRSLDDPDRLACTFLIDGEEQEARWTYGELDARARRIGALLQRMGPRGERVLLLYPPGLDYVAAFFGCLYAGAVAVPAYPPNPAQLERSVPRLRAIVENSRASAALSTTAIVAAAGSFFGDAPELANLLWLATDELPEGREADWQDPGARSDSLAFLQYTSGSTGTPKGVMLSHGNLLHNSARMSEVGELTRDSVMISWLPPYHDMGLIGGILQ